MWLEALLVVGLCTTVANPVFSWEVIKFTFRKTGWMRIVALVLLGGMLGAVSWLIYGSAILCAWWFAGVTVAVGTSVVVGKLTTPLWVVGMTYEAGRHCPPLCRLLHGIKPFWERNYATVVGVTIALTSLLGMIWACWPH